MTYSLTTKPTGMTLTGTVVQWTPSTSQYGANNVVLQVTDSSGGSVTQSWSIQVTATATNHPPTITSVPPLVGVVGQLYAYNATASDPDGDPIGWKLVSAPAGMSVDSDRGTVRWTPATWQSGNQTVTLEAYDPHGDGATQSFTIGVYASNQPPVILSTPPMIAAWKRTYSYAIQVVDPDGDGLSYNLSYPTGALVNANITSSGLLTAVAQLAGVQQITITVTDSAGLTATQTYPLDIVSGGANYPPAITSTPPMIAVAGSAYSYQVAVSDPDNDTHTFALSTSYTGSGPPTINSTSGLVSWSAAVAGTYQLTVTVTDAGGLTATQTYTLAVGVNTTPTINSTAPTGVTLGLIYRYDVQASDTDGDALAYSLSNAPSGMTIDSYGEILWTPTATGTASNIVVKVTDSYGAAVTQTFSVTVSPDTTPPSLQLQLNPTFPAINQQDTILVFASDNVGVASLSVTVNGTELRLDEAGEAYYTPTAAGNYTVTATAKDAAGNTTSTTQTLVVTNPSGTPPTISLTTPAVDADITAPINLAGTVSDDHVGLSYTVNVLSFDGTPPRLIGSGSTTTSNAMSLNGIVFDPTLLADGDYTIEIKVTDDDDNLTTTLDRPVSVSANLKLGREQLSVTDLTIPVAGIPLTITRGYDSLEANKSFDFGYGWRLSYGDAKLTVDLVPGADIGWGGYPAFLNGTHVYVTMPGGAREGFTFEPYQDSVDEYGIFLYWHPYFVPDPGVTDTLKATDEFLNLDPNTGEYYESTDDGIDTYNPADPTFGGTYTVTDVSGLASTVNATTGKLISMKARNGNTLTFTADGITSNTGRAVTFTRNPAGQITAITDPRGNSVRYSYDINGNLVAVTDRANDPPTAYSYDASHAHYLAGAVDPSGVEQMHISYDTSGRMQTKTKDGDPVSFSYDTTALTTTISDPQTPPSTVGFNTRGDVTSLVDPTGAQTVSTFNNTQSADIDLPDTVTKVRRNDDGTTTNFTTEITYNALGEGTTMTDASGATTYVTYGAFGVVATTSDPLGNTITNTFDPDGNLLNTTSAAGVIDAYDYDPNNNLLAITPIDPTFLIVSNKNNLPPAGVTFSYDSFGELASSTTPAGVTTTYSYDANGNRTGTSLLWVNPANPTQTQQVTTAVGVDPNDHQTSSTDMYGHTGSTPRDIDGEVRESVDELGNATRYIRDGSGDIVQTSYPDGTVSDTVYDAEGRTSYTDDPHVPGQADVHGTHILYDDASREIETDRLDNLVIQVTETDGVWSSQVVSAGTLLSSEKTGYNDLGQVVSTTDAANQTTYFQYDAAGNQTVVTDPLNETTQTLYDAAGREVGTVDALGHTTQFVLNGDGKVIQTTFPDGTYTRSVYGALGHCTSTTNQMGQTSQFQFDRYGHMTAVLQPAVFDPVSGHTVAPTALTSYDAYGNATAITDPAGNTTQFTFDAFGHPLTRTLPAVAGVSPTEATTYDAYGREASFTDAKGQVEDFAYDPLGRLASKTFYASANATTPGETVGFQFDVLGRLSETDDTTPAGTRVTQYGYDLDGNTTSVTTPEGTVHYAYDPATGFHTETYTASSDIVYTPDALQRVQTVTVTKENGATLTTPLVTTYAYTEVGTMDHVSYPNGTETDYGYDTLNRVITVSNIVSGTGQLLSSYVYTLQADGLRTGATEQQLEADGTYSTVTKAWSYDVLGRLTQEAYTTTLSPDTNNYTDQYGFDLAGNRVSQTHTAAGHTLAVSYQYDADNELTSESGTLDGTSNYAMTYGYDSNGSLVSVVRTGSDAETDSYGYDLQNRFASADISRTENGQAVSIQASYTYDEAGYRAQAVVTTMVGNGAPSTTTTQYLVDPNNRTGYSQVLEEHTNGSASPSMTYVVGQSIVAQTDGAGTTSVLLPDAQGSTRLVTDASAGIIARYAYSAYGSVLGVSIGVLSPPVTAILYVGQRFDVATGQYYLRARDYQPANGRFTTRDPLREASNDANAFRYAGANPVAFIDPSGMQADDDEELEVAEVQTTMRAMWMPAEVTNLVRATATARALTMLDWVVLGAGILGADAFLTTLVAELMNPVPIRGPGGGDVTNDPNPDCACPATYDYGPLDGLRRATGAFARFSNGQVRTGREFRSVEPDWWGQLPAPPVAGNGWDRGHLVGAQLGGAGAGSPKETQLRNMVPLYAHINRYWMTSFVENVVAAWASAGFCIEYLVAANYTGANLYPDSLDILVFADNAFFDMVQIPNDPTW